MDAKKIKATVLENVWLTPNVISLRFESNKIFQFQPGQFLSLFVPNPDGSNKAVRRAYSFAGSPDAAKSDGYELCAKYHETGIGTNFLRLLKPGDQFEATAPYGDFHYQIPKPGRSICFIATGTGIAPFRSILQSEAFKNNPPENTHVIFGVRHENEILFQADFEHLGVNAQICVSQPKPNWNGFKGRVTDFLKTLPPDWQWHTTDFYICGNSDMIHDARQILVGGHAVKERNIYQEAFFMKPSSIQKESQAA